MCLEFEFEFYKCVRYGLWSLFFLFCAAEGKEEEEVERRWLAEEVRRVFGAFPSHLFPLFFILYSGLLLL